MPLPRTTSEPGEDVAAGHRRRAVPAFGAAVARGILRTGTDSPGQQRFVGLQIVASTQHRVGRHAIALGEHDEVAAHDLAAGDSAPLARRGSPARAGW